MLSPKGFFTRMTVLVFCVLPAVVAQHAHQPGHFLTEPREGTAEQIVLDYVRSSAFANNFAGADLADLRINAEVPSAKGQASHVYFDQYTNGIQIFHGVLNATVMNDGRIASIGNRLVNQTSNAVALRSITLSAQEALNLASVDLEIAPATSFQQLQLAEGPAQEQVFAGENLSHDDIPMKLMYFQHRGDLRLAWHMIIRQTTSLDWWEMLIDVSTGEVLGKYNYTISEYFPPNAFTGHLKKRSTKAASLHRELINKNRLLDGSAYYVLLPGTESPNHGELGLVTEPADAVASPFGWHDTNGVEGPELQITRGNNVHAFQARDADVTTLGAPPPVSQGDEPDGGAALQFNFIPDFSLQPVENLDATTVNLFFWNNLIHDLMVHYGFDEASGNFQELNYSGQGVGSDSVNAHVQAGANLFTFNNATFSTPAEGNNPSMNMYEWIVSPIFEVDAPLSIAGNYPAGIAFFGPFFPLEGLTGNLELVMDNTSSEGCFPLVGFTPGNIAVIDRGTCNFSEKVFNAQNAGAIAAIIINNDPAGGAFSMLPGTFGDQVTIPSTSLSFANGSLIKNALQGGDTVTVTITAQSSVNLDSAYDSGIIMHEYGHGISNRLVGGPNLVNCLRNEEQGGEGWSDFYGLVFSPGDGTVRDRGVGTYVLAEPTDGLGIRPFPYSPDMEINPVTYDAIKTASIPHGVGHVLNTMMWDLYWALVDEVGFDEDLYTGTGGNNIAIMLVTEALKVSPCSPSFVDYRDAILTADLTLYDSQFRCLIWNVFARRGLGVNALAGSSASRADGTEDFTVPPECIICNAININSQPTADLVCTSEDVTLTVVASGTDLTYQWFKGEDLLQGETSASLQLTAVTVEDAGSYTCTITNPCDEQTTAPAVLVVQEALTFDNTGFARWRSQLACGDVNGNNLVDILDMVDLVPNPGIVSNP